MSDRIVVVIPCYRVTTTALDVVSGIGDDVDTIYCVDDGCPDGSGDYIEANCRDPRVVVLRHPGNLGVGAAMVTGYRQALKDGAEIIVKVDGDGQMDPLDIPRLVRPICAGSADYTKGNRFFDIESIAGMPRLRLIGNSMLSLLTKISSGYWSNFDPTNGYTAIHAEVLKEIPLDKISYGYFFESDMLFRLNIIGAVVKDIPINARYESEQSNLRVRHVIPEFIRGNLVNFLKRFLYSYVLRDFNLATLQTIVGLLMTASGATYGLFKWYSAYQAGVTTSAGTVMLAALPILIGLQFLLAAVNYDMLSVPRDPLHPRLIGGTQVGNHRVGREQ